MNLTRRSLPVLLLALLPVACQSTEGGGTPSARGIHSERVALAEGGSLSAVITQGEWNRKKMWLEIDFQNDSSEPASFQLERVSVELDGKRVPAKGFLGASMERHVDLLPGQLKKRKYGFHHLEFGIPGPKPGRYELIVEGVQVGGADAGDLVVPFDVQ